MHHLFERHSSIICHMVSCSQTEQEMNFGVKDGIIWLIIFLFKYFSDIFYSKIHFIFPLSKQKKMKNDWRMSLKKMMQTLIAQMIFRLVFLWAQFGESWLSWYMVCMPLIFLAPWFFKCRLFSDGSSTEIFFSGLFFRETDVLNMQYIEHVGFT